MSASRPVDGARLLEVLGELDHLTAAGSRNRADRVRLIGVAARYLARGVDDRVEVVVVDQVEGAAVLIGKLGDVINRVVQHGMPLDAATGRLLIRVSARLRQLAWLAAGT